MEDIGDRRYTHIFTSPEMVFSEAFSPVMNDPPFKSRLICVAVDECYLITKWDNSFHPPPGIWPAQYFQTNGAELCDILRMFDYP
jgi:hypothetical protein